MNLPVSIVIPNYNGAQLLLRNLPSVFAAADAYPGACEIIVVDDASRDDSVAVLRAQFPRVRTVVRERNGGFAEAVASGVAAAQFAHLLLLNSDVQPDAQCIAPLVAYFADETVFSVAPCVRNDDGSVDAHAWYVASFRRGALKRLRWTLAAALAARQQRRLPTLYASGGSMLVSKDRFLALGGFNPIFKPFYSEDVDLGIRAWRAGWPSYFEPQASVLHQSRGSIKDAFARAVVKRTRRRNKYLLEWLHFPLSRLLLQTLPLTALALLGEALLFDRVNLGGFVDALARLPEVRRQRAVLRTTAQHDFTVVLAQTLAGRAPAMR